MLSREQVENSHVYKTDISDVKELASCYFDWLSTLVSLAKKNPESAETLLNIVEYLADQKANEFLE